MIVDPVKLLNELYAYVLPARFNSRQANVMLVAIGLQESRFQHRKQIGGPAHGFWQFERGGGVKGVLAHASTKRYAHAACDIRGVNPSAADVYNLLPTDDLLAAAFARLLLWSDPHPLPVDTADAWAYYLRTWRPGKPHRHTWDALYRQALELVP